MQSSSFLRGVQARRDKEASASGSAVEDARQERMRIIAEAEAKEKAQADAVAAEVCFLSPPCRHSQAEPSQHRVVDFALWCLLNELKPPAQTLKVRVCGGEESRQAARARAGPAAAAARHAPAGARQAGAACPSPVHGTESFSSAPCLPSGW